MKKKLAITAMSAMLLASGVASVSAEKKSFKDIPATHNFYNEIHKLTHKGIIGGYSDGTFRASENVTRAQAATLIARALNLDLERVKKPSFNDVKENNSHYRAIAKLTELGVFKNGDKFNPDRPLTRAQMSKILVEAFELQAQQTKSFSDISAAEAMKYAGIIGALGITTNDGKFYPNDEVTRGQLAAFLERVIDYKRLSLDDNDFWDDWDDWDDLDLLYDRDDDDSDDDDDRDDSDDKDNDDDRDDADDKDNDDDQDDSDDNDD